MHIDFGEFGVATWRRNEQGEQVWRARWGDTVAEFVADRDADVEVLRERGRAALRAELPAGSG